MKKIRFMFDYHCSPIWIYDDKGELICNGFSDELEKENEIAQLTNELADEYDSLFENNETAFEYKGFSSEEDKQFFLKKTNIAVALIKSRLGNNYIVESRVDL